MPIAGHFAVRCAALGLTYLVLNYFALAVFGENPPLRLANAVALVFLLRTHAKRRWPWLLAAMWVAGSVARELAGSPGGTLLSLFNVFEVTAAALIIHRGRLPTPWYLPTEVPRYLVAWLVVPGFSAAAAASVLTAGTGGFWAAWRTWYGASAFGLLIVAPLLLSWTDRSIRGSALRHFTWGRFVGLAGIALICAVFLVAEGHLPLLMLTFPAIFLCTWQFGLLGASVVLVALEGVGIWATLHSTGAIVSALPETATIAERMQALQLYLAALVISALPMAALLRRQRQLTVELRRVGDARAEFLAAMSHEIRTPMTGVLGLADLLAGERLDERQRKYVEGIRTSGRHLLTVINDVLDFSRIESGRLQLEEIDFSVPEVLERLRSLVHPLAVERGLEFSVDLLPHSPPIVRGDPTRLMQVLLNLGTNAVKFTPRGSVRITARGEPIEGGEVRFQFEVRDTGIGIAPHRLHELFQAFTQADRSISRQYGGSGLGLAICKRLAEAMGGRIDAASTEGAGSTFTVELPLRIGAEAVPVQGTVAELSAAPRRILVAEDVEVNREILRVALSRAGHDLLFATNGAEAVELAGAERVDLVLMDVQMPVMDGVEATRRIRALPPPHGRVPIVALTANVMASEQERYKAAGMNECLMKPIDWQQLAAAIARHGVSPAASAPVPAPTPAPSAAPGVVLLDEARLGGLRAMASPEAFRRIVDTALSSSREMVAQLAAAGDPPQAAALAHRLKGSAGTVGFAAVAELAARIEAAGKEGRLETEATGALPDVLRRTEEALAVSAAAAPRG